MENRHRNRFQLFPVGPVVFYTEPEKEQVTRKADFRGSTHEVLKFRAQFRHSISTSTLLATYLFIFEKKLTVKKIVIDFCTHEILSFLVFFLYSGAPFSFFAGLLIIFCQVQLFLEKEKQKTP